MMHIKWCLFTPLHYHDYINLYNLITSLTCRILIDIVNKTPLLYINHKFCLVCMFLYLILMYITIIIYIISSVISCFAIIYIFQSSVFINLTTKFEIYGEDVNLWNHPKLSSCYEVVLTHVLCTKLYISGYILVWWS